MCGIYTKNAFSVIGFKIKVLRIFLVSLLFLIFITNIPKMAYAGPIVEIEATFTYVAPNYSYSYTVKNLSISDENVWTFSLYFPIPVFDITTPTGWDFLANTTNYPFFVTWWSKAPEYDIVINEQLSGFGFKSYGPPGVVTFDVEGSDPSSGNPTGNSYAGTTIGPTSEPNIVILLSAGLVGFWGFIRLKRK